MAFRQFIAASLAFALGTAPLFAQQGAIAGRATDEADEPYSNYTVQLRNPQTGDIAGTQVLSAQGEFSFTGLALNQYIVELVDTSDDNRVVCTEGPFGVATGALSHDVNIDCGGAPAALWIIAGAAGVAAAVAVATATDNGGDSE